MENLSKFENDLWEAADNLRANSKLTSSDYFMPVLGIIFLRHAANRFDTASRQIADDQAAGKMPRRKLQPADYIRRRALWLPESARYDGIMDKATTDVSGLPKLVSDAMTAIEVDFTPLQGVLPKDYGIFEPSVLEDLMRLFNSEQIKHATGDVFGRIYEYFLAKFSIQKAHDNGEFFTPSSLVQTIVNVIEPDHGTVFDPACGSGGMFVQSSHFIEQVGGDTARKVVFYGQEKNRDTIRIAKMNLAVHGLEGKIAEAITYYQDEHNLGPKEKLAPGKCDFVMANPPFNVDLVDAERIKSDPRLPFGLPGVNKGKKVSNGNYLWISYFWSYLSDKGRAGFVMSSQASSAGNDEREVRRKIVETGDVDVMISIRGGFFYTRTVPCELWHFDRNKPADRKDKVLMLDARSIGQLMKGSRKVYEFTPEQMHNMSAIVWLYRGQSERFIALVQKYLERTLAEAATIAAKVDLFLTAYHELADNYEPILKKLPKDSTVPALLKERDDTAKVCFAALVKLTARIAKEWKIPCEPKLASQKKLLAGLGELAVACRDAVKDIDLLFKLASRVVDAMGEELIRLTNAADVGAAPIRRAGDKLMKELDVPRRELANQLKTVAYFERQAHWLLSRFPDAKLVAVPGLVKLVDRKNIEAADWSLTPGRYVGVVPAEVDDDFDFEQSITDIHTELAALNKEAAGLAKTIQQNFEELGV